MATKDNTFFSIKKRMASNPYNESIIVNITGPMLLINKSTGRCISINVVPEILQPMGKKISSKTPNAPINDDKVRIKSIAFFNTLKNGCSGFIPVFFFAGTK